MIKTFQITKSPIEEYIGVNVTVDTIISTVNEIDEVGEYRTTMFNGRDIQLESQNLPHITLRGILKRN